MARVDRAVAGTDAERAAANVRVVSSAEFKERFSRELTAHAAVCRGQQAKPGDAVCDGGVTPKGTVLIVCTGVLTTRIYIITPSGPATSCTENKPGPPA